MMGCLDKSPEFSQTPSAVLKDQSENPHLQMDFDVELRSDLFCVQGNIMLPGNSSLAYLMLNATLRRGEIEQFNTKYLLMHIEPNRDYSFKITKNRKIPAGEYDCTLEANGPQGILAEERRRISLAESWRKTAFEQVPWPEGLDEEDLEQKNEEVLLKEERIPQKKMHAAPQEIDDKKSLESGSTSARASMQASSTLPNDDKATFMGSITSKKYHSQDCRYALKIKQENRIYFQSIEDAKGQGYLPCKSCNP